MNKLFIFTLISVFLGYPVFGQIYHPENLPGVQEIRIWQVGINQELPVNRTPAETIQYDDLGRITSHEYEWASVTYQYSGDSIFKEIYSKQMEELSSREIYLIHPNDSGYTRILVDRYISEMADMGSLYSEDTYDEAFAHIPRRIPCEGCTHREENRVTMDEEGRISQTVTYDVINKYGSVNLMLDEIYTREYVSDSVYIERIIKENYRDNLVLATLVVKDVGGGLLYRKYLHFEQISESEIEALRDTQPLSYEVDDRGNWTTRIEPGGSKKTVREIIYRE